MQTITDLLEQLCKNIQIVSAGVIKFSLRYTLSSFLLSACFFTTISSGQGENQADQTLRGAGRVNASTLGMEIDIPLGSYPGRGINIPISLSYSSKVWRVDYSHLAEGSILYGGCKTINRAVYSENAASGWTTSLATPYIEYVGKDNLFDENGLPASTTDTCSEASQTQTYTYIRRLTVHLPGGESHELRSDDTVTSYSAGSHCPPSGGYVCDPNDARLQQNWNRTYYAVDSSNIKYIEDSAANTYRLLMPDGSSYNFEASLSSVYQKTARKAVKFTDRNGNFTSYNTETGIWTDTLGKTFTSPIGASAPDSPTEADEPIEYSMPGMTGKYKFHWKYLKGGSQAESGLTDFSQSLKYRGDKLHMNNNSAWQPIPAGSASLFSSIEPNTYILAEGLFNPVVLTRIELPTGQSYKFTYDIYGRIERIYYPTGGEERFVYNTVAPLAQSAPNNVTDQANFGVTNRKVYPTAGQSADYEWNYNVTYAAPSGYKVKTISPDGTINERILHRGNGFCPGGCTHGTFGYDNILAGMPYEELNFSNTGQLVTRKLTHWADSGSRHPRVDHEESYIYDSSGNGVAATTKYEYEGDLSQRETPVLRKKILQYAFVPVQSGSPFASLAPGAPPLPNPTPVPTPAPPTLMQTAEATFLINDTSVANRQSYRDRHMVGLVTASVVRDAAGTIVSRSEMNYDESGYSPTDYVRGNPTTSKVWDSTKGSSTNSNAYISTRARFDDDGNQTQAIDAKGNTTVTEYDSTHNAFPVKVISPIPGNGTNGSNTAFETTATYDPATGLPLSTKDVNDLETRITYDPATLRPLNVKTFYNNAPVGGQSETIYHDEPNNYWVKNRSQIDENNWAESITYFDGLGRAYRTEQFDSEGNVFADKEFDADGRVSRISNPYRSGEAKHWTTNVYDESSRIKEVILPDGAKVRTDYGVLISDVIGVTKQITDQAGKKRKGITDSLGRMIRVIEDPNGQALPTDYVFDTLGNLRKTVQGEQSRYFSYDSLGRLLRAKQPEQDTNPNLALTAADPVTGNNAWSVSYQYDNNGNITKTTDARGVSVEAVYDKFNRIISRNYSDATPDVGFYYDGTGLGTNPGFSKGKTTRVDNGVSSTRYKSFDVFGRVLTHEQITDGKIYQTGYAYNLSGALIEETYPSTRKVKHILDDDGDLSLVKSRKTENSAFYNYASNFTYDASGAVKKMQFGNGLWENYSYNNRQQIVQIGLGTSHNSQNLLKLEYGYGTSAENNGSLREQKITVPTIGQTSGFTAVQTYIYDNLNRLQSAEEKVANATTWKQTFSIDRYGNRRFNTSNNNTTTLSQSAPSKVTNPLIKTSDNRFQSDQDGDSHIDYAYDKNGNLTLDAENKRFVYDAENHQKAFFAASNQTTTPDAVYQYDGDGKRVRKISASEIAIFVYNAGGTLVAEYSTQPSQTPQVSYLTQDHLGSPRVITNKYGIITTRQDYTAFGEETITPNRLTALGYTNQDELRKGYTGYEKDTESGLDFAQARYYNSSHGRFTSVDPLTASASIRNPQTFNRYSYVLNSPYKYVDPLGLIAQGCCSEKEIRDQIKKDFKNIILVLTEEIVAVSDTDLNMIADKLYSYYYQAAKEAYDAQSALNDELNANVSGPVRTITEVTQADPTVTTTTTVNGNGEVSEAIGGEITESITAGSTKQEAESSGKGTHTTSGGLGIGAEITSSKSTPGDIRKTTTDSTKPESKAAKQLQAANENVPKIAESAATAISGIRVQALTRTASVVSDITLEVNGIELTSRIRHISNAGKRMANIDNPVKPQH